MILVGFAEPEDEWDEVQSGPVAGGEFVEAGHDRPEPLEPGEAASDGVAGLAELAVEGRGPATDPSTPDPVGFPVCPFRDDRPDATPAQDLAHPPRRIRPVRDDGFESGARTSHAGRGTFKVSRTAPNTCEQRRPSATPEPTAGQVSIDPATTEPANTCARAPKLGEDPLTQA